VEGLGKLWLQNGDIIVTTFSRRWETNTDYGIIYFGNSEGNMLKGWRRYEGEVTAGKMDGKGTLHIE
jgi:hypothetical protein